MKTRRISWIAVNPKQLKKYTLFYPLLEPEDGFVGTMKIYGHAGTTTTLTTNNKAKQERVKKEIKNIEKRNFFSPDYFNH